MSFDLLLNNGDSFICSNRLFILLLIYQLIMKIVHYANNVMKNYVNIITSNQIKGALSIYFF